MLLPLWSLPTFSRIKDCIILIVSQNKSSFPNLDSVKFLVTAKRKKIIHPSTPEYTQIVLVKTLASGRLAELATPAQVSKAGN